MSENACHVSRVIALEEHVWTPSFKDLVAAYFLA
jgi:hypothetical protein